MRDAGECGKKVRDGRLKGGAHRPFPAGGLLGASGRVASKQQRLAGRGVVCPGGSRPIFLFSRISNLEIE